MAKFHYAPLDTNRKEIRILRIHPACSSTTRIECTVLHVSLGSSRKPKYETVSYCWGDAATKATIILNSRLMETTSSAASALQRMRLPDRTRAIWIDAICINQADDVEKSHQVAFMADIYSHTSRNLVWLGPDDDHTKAALAAISDVIEDACRESNDFQQFELFKNDAINYSHCGLAVKFNATALVAFFNNPWFERVWVLQEAVLAPFSLCHYGPYEIPLLDVLYLAAWLLTKSLFLPFALSQGMHNARAMWVYKYSRYRVPSMIQLLENLRSLKCRDPRDHVYGTLGIHNQRRAFVDEKIVPDYQNKVLADVLTEATNLAIAERLDLYFCNLVSHRRYYSEEDEKIPSWIPRWERAVEPSEDSAELRHIFQANGSHAHPAPELDTDLGTRFLHAKGIVVSTVRETWTVIKNTVQVHEMLEMIHSVQSTLPNMSEPENVDGAGITLAKTLVAGTTIDNLPVKPDIVGEQYLAWLQGIRQHSSFPPRPSLEPKASEFETKGATYQQAFRNASFNRRLLLTKSGMLGLGPQNTQPNDLIVVLWGCYWPIILRPSAIHNEYTMLGAAYIEGIMHGEAVPDDNWEHDEDNSQIFPIS